MELGSRALIPLMKRVRRLDKPVDELARGKAMEKVLILFFVKTVRFNKKASVLCPWAQNTSHRSPTRLWRYKTALSRFMGDQYDTVSFR